MRYGLIVFKDTENIGDDIQSYAAMQFLPHVDYYIEREAMNLFISNNNEIVKTIFSGWYLHNPFSFPPSPYIDPLIISIHFYNEFINQNPIYLDSYGLKYLQMQMPIGCRDIYTQKILSKYN